MNVTKNFDKKNIIDDINEKYNVNQIPKRPVYFDMRRTDTGELVTLCVKTKIKDGKIVDLVVNEYKKKDVVTLVTNSMWKNMRRSCKSGGTPSVINKDGEIEYVEYRKRNLYEISSGRLISCPKKFVKTHGDIDEQVPVSEHGELITSLIETGMTWDDALSKGWEITESISQQTEEDKS